MKLSVAILATLFLGLLATPSLAQLTQERPLGRKQGVTLKKWVYKSDGLKVHGELYLPEGKKKLPLVVFNHDGIHGISREHRLSSIRLAKAGFVVFSPSYRGEDGSQGMIEIAKGEVNDVLNVLPLLEKHPRVAKDKIALVGASHGALISFLAASRVDRFKAVVSAYGVTDIYKWYSYLKRSGKLGKDPITIRTYGLGPKKRPESFRIRNAVSVAKNIQCPVLILQGSQDEIVPEEQAHFMDRALKKAGKKVTTKIYPDALHGFLVYAPYLKQASRREKRQTEQAWDTLVRFLRESLKTP